MQDINEKVRCGRTYLFFIIHIYVIEFLITDSGVKEYSLSNASNSHSNTLINSHFIGTVFFFLSLYSPPP